MANNPFLGDSLRPDQQKWASTHMGLVSPLWLPFIAAAGVGAAWWTMTHWARVMGSGYPGATGTGGNGAAQPAAPAPQSAPQAAPQAATPAAAAPPQVHSLAPEAESLAAGVAESLAVQGDDAAPAARQAEPAQPKSRPAAKAAPQAAPAPKPAAAPKPKAAAAPATSQGDDHPAPTLPPHEGLPARKKGGGGKKKSD